ncbi:MAG: HAMP domain-containing sensor histidine kinase [Prevotellaceae bacterium]|nr:HAMP domain-containing sensor histidine kinase [Prevotellaceae bacterium]
MKTLLSKTNSRLVACTAAIFALTAPLFYYITKHFYAEDMIDIIESVQRGQGIPALDLERDIVIGMMLQFMLIFIVISVSLFITMRFITRRMWLPFNDTLRKTEQFNLAQDEIPCFLQTDTIEFDSLNRSLTKLMEKDIETFRIQKEFSENASHELQTPLAVMRSKLDLLLQEDLNETQMKLVEDLNQLTTRMSHLNRNLLLLAKIDNAQYSQQEEISLSALIAVSLPLYGVLQGNNRITVTDNRKHKDSLVKANPVLMECLLKNLIVNAIRHTNGDGEISITLADGTLTVSNPSSDGTPLNPETLFRRFRSSGVQGGGNGLGLSIVKAICDFHGWNVAYNMQNQKHCFTVTF